MIKDKSGNVIIDFRFETARQFRNGYAKVCINGKWGLIDTFGKLVIECKYIELDYAMGDTVAFTRSGKRVFLDINSNIVIPNIYANVSYFNESYAGVSLNRKLFLIDRNGNPLKRKYDQNNYALTEAARRKTLSLFYLSKKFLTMCKVYLTHCRIV